MERDPHGRFTPGHSGGPGRPPKPVEHKYALAIRKAVSLEDVADILRAAVKAAKQGDWTAARIVLTYTVGVPVDVCVETRLQELESHAEQRSN